MRLNSIGTKMQLVFVPALLVLAGVLLYDMLGVVTGLYDGSFRQRLRNEHSSIAYVFDAYRENLEAAATRTTEYRELLDTYADDDFSAVANALKERALIEGVDFSFVLRPSEGGATDVVARGHNTRIENGKGNNSFIAQTWKRMVLSAEEHGVDLSENVFSTFVAIPREAVNAEIGELLSVEKQAALQGDYLMIASAPVKSYGETVAYLIFARNLRDNALLSGRISSLLNIDSDNKREGFILSHQGEMILAVGTGVGLGTRVATPANLSTPVLQAVGDPGVGITGFFARLDHALDDAVVTVLSNKGDLQNAIKQIRVQSLRIGLTITAILVALSILVVHFLLRPIRYLVKAAQEMTEGRYSTRVEIASRDEVGVLAHGFNQMAGSIENNIQEIQESRRALQLLVSEGRQVASQVDLWSLAVGFHRAIESVTCGLAKSRVFYSGRCFPNVPDPSAFFELENAADAPKPVPAQQLGSQFDRMIPVEDPRDRSQLALIGMTFARASVAERLLPNLEVMATNLASAITTVRLQNTFAALFHRTKEVQTIFGNINQGICLVDDTLQLLPDYSAHLESILGERNLQGRNLLELLFDRSDIEGDRRVLVRSALQGAMGEPSLAFTVNEDSLPREMEFHRGRNRLVIEIDWTPIFDDNDITRRVMVTLRDVTVLHQLKAAAEANRVDMEKISQIIKIPPHTFTKFISSAKLYVKTTRSILADDESLQSSDGVNEIRRSIHTIKGNSRSFNLTHLVAQAHSIEDIIANYQGSNILEIKGRLLEEVHKLDFIVDDYESLSENRLGRSKDRNAIVYSLLEESIQYMRHTPAPNMSDPQFRDRHSDLYRRLVRATYPTMDSLCTRFANSLEGIARQRGLKPPSIILSDGSLDVALAAEFFETLHSAMSHLVNNSFDHSFSGRNGETIFIELRLHNGYLEIHYRDNGRGLDLSSLHRRAIERGLLRDDATDDEIAQSAFVLGLTTAERVTETSGRGIGMDAIRSILSKADGFFYISLSQKQENGTTTFERVIGVPERAVVEVFREDGTAIGFGRMALCS